MKSELEQAVATAVQELFDVAVDIELTRPDEQFGDFATNVALQLAKQVGQNPREIADKLAEKLRNDVAAQVSDITVAGPGFLNLKLTDAALIASAQVQANKTLEGKTVLVEYSDPNPFKPLHAGHLYTTLVGDTLARLVERAGAAVTRLNYGGDVGLHVAKSMWAIIRELGESPEKLHDIPETERAAWLGERYVQGNNAYDDDETAKAEIVAANKAIYLLQAQDDHTSPLAQMYWTCRQWSYDYFDVLYQQLRVVPFDRYIPESEVTKLGFDTVQNQLSKGVFEQSDGAVIFDGEKVGLHKRVFINSEGLPTYESKDVGLSLTKWNDYHFDQSIIITANEQAQYMQVVIAAIKQFAPEPAERTRHLTHGFVKLQGGEKMSSRKGNIVSALEIIEAAHQAGKESGRDPSEETTLAAIKYAFAKNRIGGDIAYDPKESIALEGNSGPYLQYAHARARSILARASESPDISGDQLRSEAHVPDVRSASVLTAHPELPGATEALNSGKLEAGERSLLRKITEFGEVLDKAIAELMPHHICGYLYELAQTFNGFYEQNRVIGDAREATRLVLVTKYADTLKDGLELLGITAPERM